MKGKKHSEETKQKIRTSHNSGTGIVHILRFCKCGTGFYSDKKSKKYCTLKCAYKYSIGHPGYMLGKKQSQHQKDLLSSKLKGRIPKNLLYIQKMPRSDETRLKKHLSQLGEKGSNWKGGISTLVQLIRKSFKYRQWRSDVFTRDDFTCQGCFIRGGTLHAHHIKYFSVIFSDNEIKTMNDAINCEELWNINNGRTLCKSCHKEIHTNNLTFTK